MTQSHNNSGFINWLRARKVELIALVVAMILVAIDQATKLAIAANFSVGESKAIIANVLHLTYVQNSGAVFGSFSGQPYIFNTITVLVVAAGIILLLCGKIKGNWLKWTSALIISGGIGNMIDRFRLRYVVDFIDVRCFGEYWVWVFNVADCCVVVGCMMLMAYFIYDFIKDIKTQRAKKCDTKEVETNADN